VHETFQFLCKKCTFKGNSKGYLDKHVLLAPMNVTSNAAMAKHSEFIHGMDNEPNSKSPPSVSVFIVERPII
jgi:hypothetical protein